MSRFIAILDHDDAEQTYGAYVPDAPGCTAMGHSEQETVDNIVEALSEWVADEIAAGRPIPVARSYAELVQSGEYPELGKGGMVATIPLLRESGRAVRANISLDAGLLASIDEEAMRRGVTRSAFLGSAARDKIKAGA